MFAFYKQKYVLVKLIKNSVKLLLKKYKFMSTVRLFYLKKIKISLNYTLSFITFSVHSKAFSLNTVFSVHRKYNFYINKINKINVT